MKYIIILLLLSLSAAGQQEFFHAQNKGLLLDEYPNAAAAYSLRRVNSRYTGPLIRVRRDSTGQAEQDIGSIGEALDTVALKAFVRNNSGFVTTWYDQSGNARNATQTTAAAQPRIVSAGVVDYLNGKPTMFFDGSNDFLGTATASNWTFLHYTLTASTNFTVARAGVVTDPEAVYCIWGTAGSGFYNGAFLNHDTRSSISLDRVLRNSVFNGSGTPIAFNIQSAGSTPANTQILGTLVIKPTNVTNAERSAISTNGAAFQKNNTNSGTANNIAPRHPLRFGTSEVGDVNTFFLLGNIQESIFYASDQTTNRTQIEQNINSYYAIY